MAPIKHGGSGTPLYNVWKSMRQRCNNRKSHDYKWYGMDGVKMCEEWDDFARFRKWATENGYKSGLTIDRVDSKGPYSPENCRWITIQEQQKNKRNVLRFPYNGRVYTVDSFCKEFGITKSMFHDREHKGWNLDEIASIPKNAIGGYRPKGVRAYHG